MSQHRRAVTRLAGASVTHRRRLLIGAVGALGASGLILGGVGAPVSAGDVNAAGNLHASVDVQGGCVTAADSTAGADWSVDPQQGTDAAGLKAAGQGAATVSVCRGDLGGPPPDDQGGSLPDDLDGIVSGELDDVEPGDVDDVVPGEPGGSLEGEVVGVVTAALDGGLPSDGDGSLPGDLPGGLDGIVPDDGNGSFPGDPGDLTGGLGGLVPDGSGIDPGGLLDRLGQIIPGASDGGGPGGNDGSGPGGNGGGAPAVNTSTNGSVSESVAVGGAGAERGGPTDVVLAAEVGSGVPTLVGTSSSPGATLPRTGGGLGTGVLRLVVLLGLGRALVGLANRR